eukprot:NODE_277_length_11973_cov_0.221895.p2 type:complete len:461 gc:universal NODE_277_length_11973_cov_0.221895:4640-3258(-)
MKNINIALLAIGIKLLLFYGYRSTDFEVHRNWLSITTSLPIDKWYYDSTSEWTLDYPPLFAYFQSILGYAAIYLQYLLDFVNVKPLDLEMLNLNHLNYSSRETIFYMRMTVLCSEILTLGYAVHKYSTTIGSPFLFKISMLLNPGIVIVDHIHFQYNGFLYGILLLSLYFTKVDNLVVGGSLFLILVLLKHIFLYIAIGYFFYFLRMFQRPKQLLALLISFLTISVISFYPFLNCLPQLVSRLFPFKRGLLHALWAPNAWALYAFADRIFAKVLNISSPSLTRGIVGDVSFQCLPSISPTITAAITLVFFTYFTYRFMLKNDYSAFVLYLQQLAMTSFMFGYHVHEKALLLPAILNLAEFKSNTMSFVLQLTSITSQLPLIFEDKDIFIHLCVVLVILKLPELVADKRLLALCWLQASMVILALILKHHSEYQFLHVMVISVVNGILNMWVFVEMLLKSK